MDEFLLDVGSKGLHSKKVSLLLFRGLSLLDLYLKLLYLLHGDLARSVTVSLLRPPALPPRSDPKFASMLLV